MRTKTVLSVVLLLAGCTGRHSAPEQMRPVKVYTAHTVDMISKDFAALAVADDATNLAFKVSGQVVAFDVTEGQSVAKGAVVAQINPRDYQLQYDAQRSAFTTAKTQFERMERLLARQAVSKSEYEVAQTAYMNARAAYENSQDVLADTKLRTPFAGIVEKKYVDTYQRVQAGEPIVRIVNPTSRTVKFTMPESGIYLLSLSGARFSVEFDNYKSVFFNARLKDYVPTSSDGTGVPVSLALDDGRLDSPSKYIISPGMTCIVVMRVLNPELKDMVAVPLTSVFAPDGRTGRYVWVVDSEQRVRLVEVTLGELYGKDMVLVRGGLSAGERVVSAGVYRLSEGERVEILK